MLDSLFAPFQSTVDTIIKYWPMLYEGTLQTLYMTLFSTALAYLVGTPLGILVVLSAPNSIRPNRVLHEILGALINIGRSIPFIILLIAILPFTRLIAGTTIGATATIVPLTICAIPFVARMVEQSIVEVEGGLIEMASAMGANIAQIIFKVLLPESFPSILRGVSITIISLIGYSAMAGAVGGGGLGDLAIRYGYHRYQSDVMVLTIILLVIIVQLFQLIGNSVSKKTDKRNIH